MLPGNIQWLTNQLTGIKKYDKTITIAQIVKDLRLKGDFDISSDSTQIQFRHYFNPINLNSREYELSKNGSITGFISIKEGNYIVIINHIFINKDEINGIKHIDLNNVEDLSKYVLKESKIMPESREVLIAYSRYFMKLFNF